MEKKPFIVLLASTIILFASVLFVSPAPSSQGYTTLSESELGYPIQYHHLILIGGVLLIVVLWYYFKQVKGYEKNE
ncbi:MAG: hypothetical protein ABH986_06550 [archaeon]